MARILCCSFLSQQYAGKFGASLKLRNEEIDVDYFVASEVCKNWPKDYSVSRLKNVCLDAATYSAHEWMILMPGIDCSLIAAPKLDALDPKTIYSGHRTSGINLEPCSLHLYGRSVFEKYRYDENYRYFYDDYDFFYNVTRSIPKKTLRDLVCYHQPHVSLTVDNQYVAEAAKKEYSCFLKNYKHIHGRDFVEKV